MVKVSHYLYIQSQGLRYLYTQAIGRAPRASVLSHTEAVLMWPDLDGEQQTHHRTHWKGRASAWQFSTQECPRSQWCEGVSRWRRFVGIH